MKPDCHIVLALLDLYWLPTVLNLTWSRSLFSCQNHRIYLISKWCSLRHQHLASWILEWFRRVWRGSISRFASGQDCWCFYKYGNGMKNHQATAALPRNPDSNYKPIWGVWYCDPAGGVMHLRSVMIRPIIIYHSFCNWWNGFSSKTYFIASGHSFNELIYYF